MKPLVLAALAIVAAGLSLVSPSRTAADPAGLDFALGQNAENQACRAAARFDAPRGVKAADIYCGAWERPSGRITVFANEASAASALATACKGDETALQSADFSDLRQVACARTDKGAIRRYTLVARRAGKVAIGEVYPSDWAPLVNAARVLTGATAASAVTSAAGQTPGLSEIEAVFPAGPPGQGAANNYELLRLRAYEYNSIWQFVASQRDFDALLAAQQQIAPDDKASEAEIRAEIGLDLSSSRRFDEAGVSFDRAEALARAADDALLLSKIENYRAMDQLNQRRFNAALALALAANRSREGLARGQGVGADINAADVHRTESRAASVSQRTLLVSLGQTSPTDRATILNAQADYIAGVAARSLGLSSSADFLSKAAAAISQVGSPPPRLLGDIVNERANLSLASGDYAAAAAAAKEGLTTIKTVAPGTRSEAHLWLALEAAQAAMGDEGGALASGKAAVDIYANQTESPGMPPDVAGPRLALLEQAWRRTGDAATAAEYFRTLSLVWDGAAARTTALLAARVALHDDADHQTRAYQDAELRYRAAVASQQVLLGDPDAPPDQVARAQDAVTKAGTTLAAAEAELRARAPAYLELLSPQASAADLQAALAGHEAYLRLVMTSQGGFGALVDQSGVRPFRTTLTSAQTDALVDRLRRGTRIQRTRLPDYDVDAAVKLYASLIGPVQDRLQDVRDLDVDVSGSLASIPFAELVATPPTPEALDKIRSDSDYSGVDWAARRFTIVNTLGPASFIRLRKQPPETAGPLSAVAYGDFQPDPQGVAARVASFYGLSDVCRAEMAHTLSRLPPLPDTADEARSVASAFSNARVSLGKDFTDADFLHDPATAKADVILLATHGVLAISPCFPQPALLTSLGATGTGLIEAAALLDEQLSARLVLLSACDTAAGGKLDEALTGLDDGGDALSGLARAFIYAGAHDVLASEWSVDAASSKAEIAMLLKDAAAGKSVRAALSDAEASLYAHAETAHPFYWAPFILVGDGVGTLGAPPAQINAAMNEQAGPGPAVSLRFGSSSAD